MFNYQARWDRVLPSNKLYKGEPIEVLIKFSYGKIVPLAFSLQQKRMKIDRIYYSWKKRQGLRELFYFNVSCAGEFFCLLWDTMDQRWYVKILNSP
ncbi:MAG: hypothetical protein N2606_01040 [Candidatus Omnitrophica bacterium]|nr:hypothetical protein [Candidatus Omnitrophota bacterium]